MCFFSHRKPQQYVGICLDTISSTNCCSTRQHQTMVSFVFLAFYTTPIILHKLAVQHRDYLHVKQFAMFYRGLPLSSLRQDQQLRTIHYFKPHAALDMHLYTVQCIAKTQNYLAFSATLGALNIQYDVLYAQLGGPKCLTVHCQWFNKVIL